MMPRLTGSLGQFEQMMLMSTDKMTSQTVAY